MHIYIYTYIHICGLNLYALFDNRLLPSVNMKNSSKNSSTNLTGTLTTNP